MEVNRYIRGIDIEAPDIRDGADYSRTALTVKYCSNDTRFHQVEIYGSPALAREIHRLMLVHLMNKRITLEMSPSDAARAVANTRQNRK